MTYRIRKDEPVGVAIRRIDREQTHKALDDLANSDQPIEWRIHQLRKRCKGIRALVRLVWPGFPEYKAANTRFRDIARELSAERDARVMAHLVRKLTRSKNGKVDDQPLVRWFAMHSEIAEVLAQPVLDRAAQTMARAAVEVEQWPIDLHDRSVLLAQLNALPEFLKRNMSVQRVAVQAMCERRKLRRKVIGMCDGPIDEKPENFAAIVELEWARSRAVDDERREPDRGPGMLSMP